MIQAKAVSTNHAIFRDAGGDYPLINAINGSGLSPKNKPVHSTQPVSFNNISVQQALQYVHSAGFYFHQNSFGMRQRVYFMHDVSAGITRQGASLIGWSQFGSYVFDLGQERQVNRLIHWYDYSQVIRGDFKVYVNNNADPTFINPYTDMVVPEKQALDYPGSSFRKDNVFFNIFHIDGIYPGVISPPEFTPAQLLNFKDLLAKKASMFTFKILCLAEGLMQAIDGSCRKWPLWLWTRSSRS